MMRSFFLELFIAIRYLRGQGRTVVFSLGTRLSFIFMSLMVFIMVLVLSVFNGFQQEVHRSLWNSGYHLTVSKHNQAFQQDVSRRLIETIPGVSDLSHRVRSIFPSISINALLEIQNQFEGKAVRAIPVDDNLESFSGELKDYPRIVHYDRELMQYYKGGNFVIIGREMARYYGWQVGDRIRLYLPKGGSIRKGMDIREEEFKIAGFFRTGYYEFDLNIIFMSLETAQRTMMMPDQVTEVIVQLNDLSDLDLVRKEVRQAIPGNPYSFMIRTIKDERGNFLAALQLEKTLMIIIMGLLIIAGVAGIWVTVHLLVKAKNRSIGMLRAMGLPTSSIIIIFTAHSMLIGFLSTAVGGALGIYIANRLETIIQLVEEILNGSCNWLFGMCAPIQLIPRNIYYFDHLPVYADMNVIFGVTLTTMILSGLAGYFPSRRAAILDPVETIRND